MIKLLINITLDRNTAWRVDGRKGNTFVLDTVVVVTWWALLKGTYTGHSHLQEPWLNICPPGQFL